MAGTININQLLTEDILLSDFLVKADSNGLATKATVQELANKITTIGDVSFKGSVASTDATVGSDGWYFAEDSGTYTNNGGLVIDLSNNLAIIIVSNTQTTFSKIDIPLNITFDATPTSGSTDAVTSEGIKAYVDGKGTSNIDDADITKFANILGVKNERNTRVLYQELLTRKTNGISFEGKLVFDKTGLTVTISGDTKIFDKKTFLGTVTPVSLTIPRDYFIVYVDSNLDLKVAAWADYVIDVNDLVLARVNYLTGTFSVPFCITSSYSINGKDYTNYTALSDVVIPDYTPDLITPTSLSNDLTLYNGLVTFDNTTKIIKVTGGGFMNREGTYTTINNASFDCTGYSTNDYLLHVARGSTTLILTGYNQDISSTFKDSFFIARFSFTGTDFSVVHNCICDYVLNGDRYYKFKKDQVIPTPKVLSKKYVEIGDSISWQYDGKKENFRSSYPTENGYIFDSGYGQLICDYFGISYANHFSHGLNGRTFCNYISEILTPVNGDNIWNVPQNGDLYTIFLGTNDYGFAETLGTKADYLNDTFIVGNSATKTVYGGIRKLVDYVTSTATTTKNKKIVFITPMGFGAYAGYGTVTSTWQYGTDNEIIERPNSKGWVMSELVTAIQFAADQIGAYVIDLYGQKGIAQRNRLNIGLTLNGSSNPEVYQTILGDNLHPNTEGHRWLGNFLAHELEKIFIDDNFI
jgi:lysophospholipase L1-like esterase